ncbi:hypothetical protein [Marinobacter subterrani]|uniref:Uncharacterized protein n=1 Tax=Marinobacter subterrani TaxID=1658765 RepID=A0A0J7J6F3_9GAMM|nr:hypothetical protein [Marinobacter subterrani]KMQ74093.1 hypothetical protein Msub_10264 [Marinobacter subterrani]
MAAAEAVRYSPQPVTVLLDDKDADMPPDRIELIRQDLGIAGSDLRMRALPVKDPVTIAQILRQERVTQLVVSRDCALLRQPGADALLAALDLPVTITP